MDIVVAAKDSDVKKSEENVVEKNCDSDPVVYHLVRVEGDGTLVPATEDEVMQFEHLLEDEKSDLPPISDTGHIEEVCSQGLLSKKSNLEGFAQSESTYVDSQLLDCGLEEERLQPLCESEGISSECMYLNGQTHDQVDNEQSQNNKGLTENVPIETPPKSTVLNGCGSGEIETTDTCSRPPKSADEAATTVSSISGSSASLKPNFSLLKGEICLDNFSIRELQEVFMATFGRHTSVKDKLWLKRRIAMGLTNSCDVPTTGFIIKKSKIIIQEDKEHTPCTTQRPLVEAESLQGVQVIGPAKGSCTDPPTHSGYQIEDLQLSGKRLRKSPEECDAPKDSFQMEHPTIKRARKPTRRYIEQLSDFEIPEFSAKVSNSSKRSGYGEASTISRIRSAGEVGSWEKSYPTRQHSLGGFGVQVPYASRVRRARPRKNFMVFVDYHPGGMESGVATATLGTNLQQDDSRNLIRKARSLPMRIPKPKFAEKERDKGNAEAIIHKQELNSEQEKLLTTGENTDSAFIQPAAKGGGMRRKHHRAWTLCEVLKLVEGVARYGAGRWSEIRRLAFASYSYRTSVDLKDKWRNLLRASLTQVPLEKEGSFPRKHTSLPIPTSILLRVRELAEMNSLTGSEFGMSKLLGNGGKVVQGKGSGFL